MCFKKEPVKCVVKKGNGGPDRCVGGLDLRVSIKTNSPRIWKINKDKVTRHKQSSLKLSRFILDNFLTKFLFKETFSNIFVARCFIA